MAFSIGRVGVALAAGGDGLAFSPPHTWQQAGRQVTLSGLHVASSRAEAVGVANQILGLDPAMNLDEGPIPVYSSDAPEVSGWYEVQSANATFDRGSLGGTLQVPWTVTMTRAMAWRRPLIEVPTASSGLVNGWGITTCDLLEAYPGQIVNYTNGVSNASTSRTGERGEVIVGYTDGYTPGAWPGAQYGTARYVCEPDEYHVGGAYVEDVETGLSLVGRHDIAYPNDVRIGNGLVRVRCDAAASSSAVAGFIASLTFQWWNGSAWTAGRAFDFSLGYFLGITTVWSAVSATVLKNAPDECILRIAIHRAAHGFTTWDNGTLDVSIRRGDRCARFFVNSFGGFGAQMAATSALACTSKAWGMRSTSTVNSEYLVLTSDRGTTRDLVNGSLSAGSGYPPCMFGIGVTSGAGTGTGVEDADGIGPQLMAVYGSTQRVVVA